MCQRAARCFQEHRDPRVLQHTVEALVTQTVATRVRAADRGAALAGKSTLNRLELAGPNAATDRYKKVTYDAFHFKGRTP